jgi:hypothetical protein
VIPKFFRLWGVLHDFSAIARARGLFRLALDGRRSFLHQVGLHRLLCLDYGGADLHRDMEVEGSLQMQVLRVASHEERVLDS